MQALCNVTLVISNCVLFNGSAHNKLRWTSISASSKIQSVITIESTNFVGNHSQFTSDIYIDIVGTLPSPAADITFFMLNSNVQSEQHSIDNGVYVHTCRMLC